MTKKIYIKVFVDLILHCSLIANIFYSNKYNGFLVSFIANFTIIASTLSLLHYSFFEEKYKRKRKNKNKIENIYDLITNYSLLLLFICNGFIITSILWLFMFTHHNKTELKKKY